MLTTLIFGVLSSVVAELITWMNKKFSGTVLTGDGAWILAAIVAIVGAIIKVLMSGVPTSLATFTTDCATVWTVSQVFFIAVMQMFNLDVSSTPTQGTTAPMTSTPTT